LIASKVVSTTGEGTVVDILLGIVGGVIGGWLFTLFRGSGRTGFDLNSVYSAGITAIGAITALAVYHAFFRFFRLLPPTNDVRVSESRFPAATPAEECG
jgi:uncharacterized membrane protein YeaQ/YmgE (transglycosylase-associated protein family)